MVEAKGVVLFCEDIRQEAGGKTSYMGVLGATMYCDTLPGVAPKLNASVLLNIRGSSLITARLTVTLENSDDQEPKIVNVEQHRSDKSPNDEWTVMLHLNLVRIPLKAGQIISVKCEIEDGPTVSGEMLILEGPKPASEAPSS